MGSQIGNARIADEYIREHAPIITESIAYIATPTQNTPGSLHTVRTAL
jgi:hypothetical protein